jgi:predicted DNA-binding WGR domain protein
MLLNYKTDRRGYTLWLERDLIGDWVLFRRWYGLFNRRGGMKRQVFLQEDDALKEIKRIERLRIRHGYQKV